MYFGIIICVKIINYLFNKCENKVYAFVFGVLLSSVVLLIVQSFKYGVSVIGLIVGIVFMFLGIFISLLLEEK